jgi:hypothetical protein
LPISRHVNFGFTGSSKPVEVPYLRFIPMVNYIRIIYMSSPNKETPDKDTPENLDALTNLVVDNSIVKFDSQCVRKKTNWSMSDNRYKFDSAEFDPTILLNDITERSPKLDALLNKIAELDANDMRTDKKLYKHFIFSDIKSSGHGAKLLASALIAKGFRLGYTAPRKDGGAEFVTPIPEVEIEQSYQNLDSILGSDSIKQLTNDTQKLMQQQQNLFNSMNQMVPVLESAKSMLSGFNMDDLQKSFKDISGLGGAATIVGAK